MHLKDTDGMANNVDPDEIASCGAVRAGGYKTFSMLNSVEHEILNAHKYKNIKNFNFFLGQINLESYFSRSFILKCQQLLAF